jgi:periplasmic copper chaperone A
MRRRPPFLAALLLTGLAGTSFAADILVGDPYARAVPPGQPNSAVFMSLKNNSAEKRALVGAESAVSDVVELHTHVNENGMMKMRRIDQIALPAGKMVMLQPGGLHVMLIGLKQTLAPGSTVDLTLVYDDGSKMQIKAPARGIAMPQPHHQ